MTLEHIIGTLFIGAYIISLDHKPEWLIIAACVVAGLAAAALGIAVALWLIYAAMRLLRTLWRLSA